MVNLQITGGSLKGFKLYGPPSDSFKIRPLRTRIRKALFDILGQELRGYKVLDLFAGTGALGIEALSRGAELAVFVDISSESLKLIQKNLEKMKLLGKAQIFKLKLPERLKNLTKFGEKFFNLIFITPPYSSSLKKSLGLKTLRAIPEELLAENAWIIVEEKTGLDFPEKVKNLTLFKKRTYGETCLWFYKV